MPWFSNPASCVLTCSNVIGQVLIFKFSWSVIHSLPVISKTWALVGQYNLITLINAGWLMVALFPSPTLMAAFQCSRHFRASLSLQATQLLESAVVSLPSLIFLRLNYHLKLQVAWPKIQLKWHLFTTTITWFGVTFCSMVCGVAEMAVVSWFVVAMSTSQGFTQEKELEEVEEAMGRAPQGFNIALCNLAENPLP